ncbi:hypothetical protein ACFE04_009627 [Oxalis oulophora]
MGLSNNPMLLLFTITTLLTLTQCRRGVTPTTTTNVLDVESSRKLSHQVLHFHNNNHKKQVSNNTTTTSSFTIEIHSRESIFKTQYKDYESLVSSRLDRDSARVNSLHTKLQFKLNDVSRSELEPLDSNDQIRKEDLSTPCSDLDTSACRSGTCLYQVAYGDGSYTVGDFVTETVSFGNSGNVNDVALGCGHDNEGLFVAAAGLIGLGGGPLSLTNQIKATSFSYCLVDRDSSSTSSLDFNSVKLGPDSVVAPLMKNSKIDTFYYVGLAGFNVGGQPGPQATLIEDNRFLLLEKKKKNGARFQFIIYVCFCVLVKLSVESQ